MKERGAGGKIVFIGSLMSLLGLPYLSVYAMTKSALAGLTRVLAAEWGRHNIQVNCIAPGFILTDLNLADVASARDEELARWRASQPADGDARRYRADGSIFVWARSGVYITGQVIAIDGGYTTTAVWPFGA